MSGDAPADCYKILQVDIEADPEVIQAAYRRLAQKFHPDVAGGEEAAARMVAINAAWEVLGDPIRRAAYDASRRATTSDVPVGGVTVRPGAAGTTTTAGADVGPPTGPPSGSRLNFGRYAGWTLGQVAGADIDYVEWLDRMPIGRPYREELDAILRRAGRRRSAAAEASERRGLFRRR